MSSSHRVDVVLVAGDLLVVRRARQGPPGRDAAARGLGRAVVARLAASHQQQSGQTDACYKTPT